MSLIKNFRVRKIWRLFFEVYQGANILKGADNQLRRLVRLTGEPKHKFSFAAVKMSDVMILHPFVVF